MSGDTYEVLKRPSLRWFLATRLLTTLGVQMISVAVGWQVYARTGRVMDLGYIGLVQFIPQMLLFPIAGTVVDRTDRRWVLVGVTLCYLASALCLGWMAGMQEVNVSAILAVLMGLAVGRVFSGPASQATLPRLVPPEELPQAASWSSSFFSIAVVVGPGLGGLAYGFGGAQVAYWGAAAALSGAALCALQLPSVVAPAAGRPAGVGEMLAGMRFIFSKPILLAAVSLDLFAVLLGGAVALLPVFAKDILHAGPEALGVLRAAPAVGATVTALALAHWPLRVGIGRTLLVTVAAFGASTLLFAWSESLALSAVALALVGATDEVSVFIRMNIVQLSTPDEVRGRVSAAEFVFIGASNELGEMESGFLAAAVGPVAAAAIGGVGAMVVAVVVAVASPALRTLQRFEDLRPE